MLYRLKPAIIDKSLHPIDRAAILSDCYHMAKTGINSIEMVIEVLKVMKNEDSETVWSVMVGVLNGLYSQFQIIGGEVFTVFKTFCQELVLLALHRVGWESASGEKGEEKQSMKLLRSIIIGCLDTFAYDDSTICVEV